MQAPRSTVIAATFLRVMVHGLLIRRVLGFVQFHCASLSATESVITFFVISSQSVQMRLLAPTDRSTAPSLSESPQYVQ
jgi:hypothetical protein